MIRSHSVVWVLGVALLGGLRVSPTAGAAEEDPKDILKKAAEATKPIQTVRYSFKRQGTGARESSTPKLEGTATFGGWSNNAVKNFHIQVKVRKPDSAETTEITAGFDGDIAYLIDHANKMVYADMDSAVFGSHGRTVRGATLADFVDPDAFADEIKAEKLELKGIVTVGGEDCYEVNAAGEGRRGGAVWFIAKKDFLPRRLDFVFGGGRDGQPSGLTMELSNLEINPKLDQNPYKLVVPPGYKQTDDFAP